MYFLFPVPYTSVKKDRGSFPLGPKCYPIFCIKVEEFKGF